MLAIVVCHVLEVYSNRWAYVFNIGVQVFLALSGYLYGKKIITNWKQWSLGRVKRVYVPMFLFLILVLPLYLIFHREVFTWKAYALNLLNLQGISFATGGKFGGGMILGIRHLWFITAIMFAYLATPILQWLSKYANWLFPILLVCVGVSYFVLPGRWVFIASWFFLYAICYLYVHLKKTTIYDIGLLILEFLIVGFVAFRFDIVTHYYNPFNRVFHDVSGVFVVIIGIKLLSCLKIRNIPKVINLFDKYSFQVFLVHYFFVSGPFSLAYVTPNFFVNVLIIIAATVVATYLFVKLNDVANKLVFDKILKVK